jgi:hypothetical protein
MRGKITAIELSETGLRENFKKLLRSGQLQKDFKKIENKINDEKYVFEGKNVIFKNEKSTLILFEKLEIMKLCYETYEPSLNYFADKTVKNKHEIKTKLFEEIKLYIDDLQFYNEFVSLLEYFQIYIQINYNIFRNNYANQFQTTLGISFEELKNEIKKMKDFMGYNQNGRIQKLDIYLKKYEDLILFSKIAKNKTNIIENLKQDPVFKNIKDSEPYFDILKIGVALQETYEFKKKLFQTNFKIKFNVKSFGKLTEEDLSSNNTLYLENILNKYASKDYNGIEQENLINEVINGSIQNTLSLHDQNKKLEPYINFYSNLILNVLNEELKYMEDKKLLSQLYKDIQKIITMMAYLVSSIESNLNQSGSFTKMPMGFLLNYNQESKNQLIQKLFDNSPFSENAILDKKDFQEIKKNLFNSSESIISNLNFRTKNDNYDFLEELNINIVERKSIHLEEGDLEDIQHSIYLQNKLNNLKKEFIKSSGMYKVFEIFNDLILNYDKNFIHGIYNRPSMIFGKNSFQILRFLSTVEEQSPKSSDSLYELFLKNADFAPEHITDKDKFIKTEKFREREEAKVFKPEPSSKPANDDDYGFTFY